jgi:hypothetical protein
MAECGIIEAANRSDKQADAGLQKRCNKQFSRLILSLMRVSKN